MIFYKRILKVITKKYKQDPDEVLIMLWDIDENRFKYLKNENSVIKQKDLDFVKEAIELKIKERNIESKTSKDRPVDLIYLNHDFSLIGKNSSCMSYINKEEVLKIHKELVEDFKDLDDPIFPAGLKDENLLDSALFHPQTAYSGKTKYPTVETVGAALMYAISNNHAFHNGNKRTAIVALLVFLDRHNISLNCSDDDLFKLSIRVADHKMVKPEHLYSDAEIHELARWIHENSKIMTKGERPITLKKFKQILTHFGCEILNNGKVMRITEISLLGFKIKKQLLSKKTIDNTIADGCDVDRGLVKSIREDLELDTAHSIDSKTFYEKTEFSSGEFIIKYKNLLRRLSKI